LKAHREAAQRGRGDAFLRRFLFLANQGRIRCCAYEEQLNQMSCLTVVTNALVAWNSDQRTDIELKTPS